MIYVYFEPTWMARLARCATVAQLNKAPHNRIRNLPVKRHQATKKKEKISQLLARRAELCGWAGWGDVGVGRVRASCCESFVDNANIATAAFVVVARPPAAAAFGSTTCLAQYTNKQKFVNKNCGEEERVGGNEVGWCGICGRVLAWQVVRAGLKVV